MKHSYQRHGFTLNRAQRLAVIDLVLKDRIPRNIVARQFRIHWKALDAMVRQAAKERGIEDQLPTPFHPRGRRPTPLTEKSSVARLVLDDGMTLAAASRKSGRSVATIRRWIAEPREQLVSTDAPTSAPEAQPTIAVTQDGPSLGADTPFHGITEITGEQLEGPISDQVEASREMSLQVEELRRERDLLRLVVAHFVTPMSEASSSSLAQLESSIPASH